MTTATAAAQVCRPTLQNAADQGVGHCRIRVGSMFDIMSVLKDAGIACRSIDCYDYASEPLRKGERVLVRVEMPGGPGGIVGPRSQSLLRVAEVLRDAMARRRTLLLEARAASAEESEYGIASPDERIGVWPLWHLDLSPQLTAEVLAQWHNDGRFA